MNISFKWMQITEEYYCQNMMRFNVNFLLTVKTARHFQVLKWSTVLVMLLQCITKSIHL